MSRWCGECGEEDCDPEYIECCGVWMCDRCVDIHDAKYPRKDASIDAAMKGEG